MKEIEPKKMNLQRLRKMIRLAQGGVHLSMEEIEEVIGHLLYLQSIVSQQVVLLDKSLKDIRGQVL